MFPYSHQISIGVQRQVATNVSIEADWVYTGERGRLQGRNINIAFNPATGANYRFVGAGTDVTKRVYPDGGNTQVQPPGRKVQLSRVAGSVYEAHEQPVAGLRDLRARRFGRE